MANKTGLLLGLAGLGGVVLLALRSKKAPPEGEDDGEDDGVVTIVVYDENGNIIPAHSPVTLAEGGRYSFSYTVRNTSTRAGIPIGVSFLLTEQVAVGGVKLAGETFVNPFGAGQTITYGPIYFNIPWDTGGKSGAIDVLVEVPATGGIVASASQIINVTSVAINYGAVIVIG